MNYLNKTKYPKYNISLLDKEKKEIHKFPVDLGHLSFLGQELRNVTIYVYPIIILEFMTGYFTTEELYKENQKLSLQFSSDFEILEKPVKTLNQSVIGSTKPGNENTKETKDNNNINKENQNEIKKELMKAKTMIISNETNAQKTEKEYTGKSTNKLPFKLGDRLR